MQLKTIKKKIELSQIDWRAQKFRTSYYHDLAQLKQSVLNVGILNLPIVRSISEGVFEIVCGWRRLSVLSELHQKFCDVLLLTEKSADQALFQAVLYENLSIRDFNIMEKAFVIKNLKDEFKLPEKEIINDYLPILDLGRNATWLDWSRKLVSFSPIVQEAFAHGLLSLDLINFFAKMNSTEQNSLMTIVLELHLGKNRQKELTLLLTDITRLQNLSFEELFQLDEIRRIVDREKFTHSQKTAKLFEWLKMQRFPFYSKVKKRFSELSRSLKVPANFQIRHSPYFESDCFSLQFTFRDVEEFRKAVEYQNEICDQNKIGKLFQLVDL